MIEGGGEWEMSVEKIGFDGGIGWKGEGMKREGMVWVAWRWNRGGDGATWS